MQRHLIKVVSILLAAVSVGCVEQTMTLTSNPPGALVYMNDQEIGRTPVVREFTWYGTYDVQLRKEGFETINTKTRVTARGWNWVPFDLIAEILPVTFRDRQSFSYTLRPASTQPADPDAIMKRAVRLRDALEASEAPATTQAVR